MFMSNKIAVTAGLSFTGTALKVPEPYVGN